MISRHRSRHLVLLAALLLAGLTVSLLPGSVALAEDPTDKWSVVGKMGFSPARAGDPALALSSQDIPYLAYIDYQWYQLLNPDTRVTVQRYYGMGWEIVGIPGLSSDPRLGVVEPVSEVRVALNSHNVPYVVYRSKSDSKLKVAKFTAADGLWHLVGQAGFAYGSGINLVIDRTTDTPYVAFTDEDPTTTKYGITVMKFDGNTWTPVGAREFSDGLAMYVSLALDGQGTPYVVYSDKSEFGGSKAVVKKFTASTWTTVGAARFSDAGVADTSIDLDSHGVPYVAYRDGYSLSGQATVKRLGAGGWENVGDPRFTRANASGLTIALDPYDKPYLAFKDGSYNGKASVYAYDSFDGWLPNGSAVANPTMTEGTADTPVMTLDRSGRPWVAYVDTHNATPPTPSPAQQTTVKRFDMPDMQPARITLKAAQQPPVYAGWYNTPIDVTVKAVILTISSPYKILNLTCMDGENTVVRIDSPDGVTMMEYPFHLSEGQHSIECQTTNDAGYIGKALDSSEMPAMFNVDLTPPELHPSVSPNPVPANSPASVSPNATDNLAKPPNTSCDVPDTSKIGNYTVKCTATDLAGNSTSATANYQVIEALPTPVPTQGKPKVYLPLVRR